MVSRKLRSLSEIANLMEGEGKFGYYSQGRVPEPRSRRAKECEGQEGELVGELRKGSDIKRARGHRFGNELKCETVSNTHLRAHET